MRSCAACQQDFARQWERAGSVLLREYGASTDSQAKLGPGCAEGWVWANSAVSYLGPGQSSVTLQHGVSDVGGLLGCFKPNVEGGLLRSCRSHKPRHSGTLQ